MSFILDALKKSENERQQQKSNDFTAVPSGRDSPAAPRWLWVLGILLAINVVVVAGLLLRPDTPPPARADTDSSREIVTEAAPDAAVPTERLSAGELPFTERLQAARREQAESLPSDTTAAETGGTPPTAAARDLPASPTPASRGMATLPSLEELQLEGSVQLPPLHIDLHVFNESPARRFVSINMNQYRENERLTEGPVVREITREGVILEHDGKAFALLQ